MFNFVVYFCFAVTGIVALVGLFVFIFTAWDTFKKCK